MFVQVQQKLIQMAKECYDEECKQVDVATNGNALNAIKSTYKLEGVGEHITVLHKSTLMLAKMNKMWHDKHACYLMLLFTQLWSVECKIDPDFKEFQLPQNPKESDIEQWMIKPTKSFYKCCEKANCADYVC